MPAWLHRDGAILPATLPRDLFCFGFPSSPWEQLNSRGYRTPIPPTLGSLGGNLVRFDGEATPSHLQGWRRFWGISEKARSSFIFKVALQNLGFLGGVPGVFAQLGASLCVSRIVLPLLSGQRERWKARQGGHGLPCSEKASSFRRFKPNCCFHTGPRI